MIVVFQTLRRAGNYAVARPTRELLYTVIAREDKFKAKSFIDTFVYRAGDQIGAWSYALMGVIGLGLTGIAFVAVPISAVWARCRILAGPPAGSAGPGRADNRSRRRPIRWSLRLDFGVLLAGATLGTGCEIAAGTNSPQGAVPIMTTSIRALVITTAVVSFAVGSFTTRAQRSGPEVEYVAAQAGLPFSSYVRVDDMLYLSGQLATVPGTGLVEGGVRAETRQALENIARVVEQAGSSMDHVVKCMCLWRT